MRKELATTLDYRLNLLRRMTMKACVFRLKCWVWLCLAPVLVGGASAELVILRADYGVQGRYRNVKFFVQSYVRNERVSMKVTNTNLGGDPAPGWDKELVVRYRLNGRTDETVVREDGYLVIPAGSGGGGGGGGWRPDRGGLQIDEARYGWGNCYSDVTRRLRRMASGGYIDITVTNEDLGGDPCPGANKVLDVRYSFRGRGYRVSVNEYGRLRLPESDDDIDRPSGQLRVVFAEYGCPGRTRDVSRALNRYARDGWISVRVTNDAMGGDPAPGCDKTLRVRYRVDGREYSAFAEEGEVLQIGRDSRY